MWKQRAARFLTIEQAGLVTVDLTSQSVQAMGNQGQTLRVWPVENPALARHDATSRAHFIGSDSDHKLVGNSQADTLLGGGGADTLDGGGGADSLTGGEGRDTYYIDDANDLVTEFENQGYDIVYTSVRTTKGFENVEEAVYTGAPDPEPPPPETPVKPADPTTGTPGASVPTTPTPTTSFPPAGPTRSWQCRAPRAAPGRRPPSRSPRSTRSSP
jgi:hypothetical protein